MLLPSYSVPGVYRRPAPRVNALPRVRTDVAGFVGVAGPARLHEAVVVDDWRSYEQTYLRDERGNPRPAPEGARLAEAVLAYFTNGGARCWIVNVASEIEASRAGMLLGDLLGLPRQPGQPDLPVKRTGLELLVQQEEVSLLVVPELDATIPDEQTRVADRLPPVFEQGRFTCCAGLAVVSGEDQAPPARIGRRRLFSDAEVRGVQRYLIDRVGREQWRLFVLLAPPPGLDLDGALRWRDAIAPLSQREDRNFAAAAFYWPWLLVQPVPGAEVVPQSPLGYLAGAYARRDLADGPHAAPANLELLAAVGVEAPVDDPGHGTAYDAGINPLRSAAGRGIQVWGARTLACTSRESLRDNPLAFVNVRRCLSAIARSVERIGQPAVFETNSPLLRAQVAQAIHAYLLKVFAAGALLGDTPAQAFFVRCDETNNPVGAMARGEMLCEIGVAVAAPAEFIVFRVGRKDGVVEIEEQR